MSGAYDGGLVFVEKLAVVVVKANAKVRAFVDKCCDYAILKGENPSREKVKERERERNGRKWERK